MPERFRIESLRLLLSAGSLAGLLVMSCSGRDVNATQGGSTRVVAAKRLVRLSEYQPFNAYSSLFGASAAATITRNEEPPALAEREFPPIRADIGVSEALLGRYDRLAQAAMNHVSENVATLTPCGPTPSDKACVQQYLLSFAEKAFRHPLSVAQRAARFERNRRGSRRRSDRECAARRTGAAGVHVAGRLDDANPGPLAA